MDHYNTASGAYRPLAEVIMRSKMDSAYKVDEGYSEDTRSQDGSESSMRVDTGREIALHGQRSLGASLEDVIQGLNEGERSEIAYDLLRSLRASSIANVFDRLWPIFHKDPLRIFPAEITSLVFSHLPPHDLLEASRVSRAWRERVTDSRLWKVKFDLEGWGLDMAEIERFEEDYNRARARTRRPGANADHKKSSVSNETVEWVHRGTLADHDPTPSLMAQYSQASDQASTEPETQKAKGALETPQSDEEMVDADADETGQHDLSSTFAKNGAGSSTSTSDGYRAAMAAPPKAVLRLLKLPDPSYTPFRQPLMMVAAPGHSRVNFQYIFKQKTRLEDNWDKGRYKNFQLPHRDHPQDAHEECVYTIQYQGNFLVSGSRDRTLRVWDIETGRLARKPLRGHSGSVLCLQFDSRPEEDIIVSGSSDASVILWRFSTGKMIKKIPNAHKESVLNLKFDHRFMVTCSKDKTIKIWSRHQLRPGDKDYPLKGIDGGGECPAYIIDAPSIGNSVRYQPSSPEHLLLLEPYTHLMTLGLHGAAVNAIQIYKDQLVSASGDRNLRVWDVHTGVCGSRIQAHEKGIACVQYDGKRIVSGSSDNTIRIWDPETKAEVARLEGHTRLVRTVQAAFADLPGGKATLGAEAAEIDRQWQIAKDAGEDLRPNRPGRPPRPGSRRPRDLRARGAKIPPSGGGSRWGRIISGSYDEKVIIWKKNPDDEWVISHQLAQEEALTAAGPPLIGPSQINTNTIQPDTTAPLAQNDPTPAALGAPAAHAPSIPAPLTGRLLRNHLTPDFPARPREPWLSPSPHPNDTSSGPSHAVPPTLTQSIPIPPGAAPEAPTAAVSDSHPQQDRLLHQENTASTSVAPHPSAAAQSLSLPSAPTGNMTVTATQPPPQQHVAQLAGQPNARVFKLQFDARRIICCSQDNKIVGWDFANGDEQIIACSKFFADPQ